MKDAVPPGCLRVSAAVTRLEEGMFAGMSRPLQVDALKKRYPRDSIGFGPQREKAAETLSRAALTGKLTIYVACGDQRLRPVPVAVLERLIRARGGLPDHVIRAPVSLLRHRLVDEPTFDALSSGLLILKVSEFDSWYRKEKRKGKWVSQRQRKSPRVGRPSKQMLALRNAVKATVNSGDWSGAGKVSDLRRKLVARGTEIGSESTLGRLVDALFVETGDELYRRRQRRKPT